MTYPQMHYQVMLPHYDQYLASLISISSSMVLWSSSEIFFAFNLSAVLRSHMHYATKQMKVLMKVKSEL
jgi:hypothetical protein